MYKNLHSLLVLAVGVSIENGGGLMHKGNKNGALYIFLGIFFSGLVEMTRENSISSTTLFLLFMLVPLCIIFVAVGIGLDAIERKVTIE
jgi:hypothetical protein